MIKHIYYSVKRTTMCLLLFLPSLTCGFEATAAECTFAAFPEPYCPVNYPSGVEPITRVTFAGIDNVSDATYNGSPSLEDFTALSGSVQQGKTYAFALEGNTLGEYTNYFRVFIDWNQDGDFDDDDETYDIGSIYNSNGLDGKQATGDIVVPATAPLGITRMRVTKRFNNWSDACGNVGYGQAEDYTLMVDPPTVDFNPTDNILYVDQNVDGSSGDGSGDSWANAIPELADALQWAKENEGSWSAGTPLKIYVAKGVYTPKYGALDGTDPSTEPRDRSFSLVNHVQLFGGFDPANDINDLNDQRLLPDPRPGATAVGTILSGDFGDGTHAYHVVLASGYTGYDPLHILLDGFTISGGMADGSGYIRPNDWYEVNQDNGGGIYLVYTHAQIRHVKITENQADYGGGISMEFSDSELTLESVSVCKNDAGTRGGGIYAGFDSKIRLTNTLVARNSAYNGGGMALSFASTGELTMTNVTLSGNTVRHPSSASSGIAIDNGVLTIRNSVIDNYVDGAIDIASSGNSIVRGRAEFLDVSPVFVDETNGDYQLLRGSPAIDVGNDVYYTDAGGDLAVDVDLGGDARMWGTAIDMGAFEYALAANPDENNILYVDKHVDGGVGDGSSWGNAIPELHDALAWAASEWDVSANGTLQIWVAKGTYTPILPADVHNVTVAEQQTTFQLVSGVQLYGGFAGGETTLDERDWKTNMTILSGDIDDNDTGADGVIADPATEIQGANSYHVVTASGTDQTTVLNGFTVTAGKANGTGADRNGGGIYNDAGSTVFANLDIRGNWALLAAGGVFNKNNGALRFTNLMICNNYAGSGGGGIANESAGPIAFVNTLISDNRTAGDGGGMANYDGALSFTNVTITGNTAGNTGGGMLNRHTSVGLVTTYPFTNTIVWGNEAGSGGSDFYNDVYTGTLTLTFSHSLIAPANISTNNHGGLGTTLIYDDDPSVIVAENPNFADPDAGNYTLAVGSPAINAGNNALYESADEDDSNNSLSDDTDLAGNPRVTNLAADGIIDIGAYESPYAPISPTAGVLYVDIDVDLGKTEGVDVLSNQSGNSWEHALTDLQAAIGTPGVSEVWVAAGTYPAPAGSFSMKNGVAIYGGFPAGGGGWEERDWRTHQTILDGAGVHRVVYNDGLDATAVLDGVTITGGRSVEGGGMYNTNSSPTLINLAIIGNTATDEGGGMYNHNSHPTLTNVIINGNSANSNGGGMLNWYGSSPVLTNVLISSNSAANGGGIFSQDGAMVLTNVTIAGNTASNWGGGMLNQVQASTISYSFTNVILWGNTAAVAGPGIYNNIAPTGGLTMVLSHSLYEATDIAWTSGGSISIDGGSASFSADPQFVDATNGDYRLLPGSPAIDAGNNALYESADGDDGNNSLGTDVDLAGVPRVHNHMGVVDMGAYEYQPVDQTISTVADIGKTYGDEPFEPGATADSGLPVSYASSDNTIAEAFEDTDDGNKWKIRILKAGEAMITASQAGNSDYLPADDQTFTLTIAKRPVEIGFANDASVTKEYDGTIEATVTADQLAFAAGDVIDGDDLTVTLGDGSAAYASADAGGDKSVTLALELLSLTGSAADNYTIGNPDDITGSVGEITPKALTVRTAAIGKVYDGTDEATLAFEPFTVADGLVGSDAVSVAFTGTAAYGSPDVGSWDVTLSASPILDGADADNYTLIVPELTGEITKRPVTVSFAAGAAITKVYDGTAMATVTASALAFGGGEVIAGDELSVSLSSGAGSYADKNAGTDKKVTLPLDGITLGGADKDNYSISNNAPVTGDAGVITSRPLTITANNHTVLYSGTAYSGGNGVAYAGFVPGEDASVLGGTLSYSGSSQGAVEADTYTITPAGLTSSDYAIIYINGTLTISGGAANILSFNVQQASSTVVRTYGEGDVDGSAVASSGLSVTYGSSKVDVATIDANGQIRIKGVGTTTITASQGGNVNYAPATDISFSLEVQPKALTVTARNATKVYDGAPYSGGNGVVYAGFVPGEDESVLSGTVTYGGSSQGATDVGSYVIEPSGLSAANYTITYTDGRLDIVPAGGNVLTFDSQTAGSTVAVVYGAKALSAAARATSGLVAIYTSSNETVAMVSADGTVTVMGTGSTVITASQPGDANHDPAADISFELRVSQKELIITANNDSKTYDGAAYSGGNGVQYTGFAYGEDESVLGGTLTYGGSSQGATDVGSYGIVPGGYTSSNYAIAYRNGSLSVTKRPVTVSFAADGAITKVYDGTAVATVTSQDLAFGAGEVMAGDELSVSLSSGTGSYGAPDAGTDKEVMLPLDGITLAGGDRDNYAVGNTAPVKGDVGAITRKALTITANNHTVLYSGTAYSGGNGVAYEGFVPGEDESVLSGTLTYEGTSQGAVEADTYTITPGGLTSSNYAVTFADGTLVISGGAANILSFNVQQAGSTVTRIYGGGDVDGSAIASSRLAVTYGSSEVDVATIDANGQIRIKGVGTTTITASQGGNVNYAPAADISFMLEVQPKALTVTARNATRVYDGVPYSGGAGIDYNGFIPGEDASVVNGTLAYGGGSQGAVDVGSYAIIPSGLSAANYTITYTDGRLDIVPSGGNVLTFDNQAAGSTMDVVYGAEALSASARATSGLAVTYSSGDESVATVSADGTVTIRGAGSTLITANQQGDINHDPATGISFELRVARKELTITANNDGKTYDGNAYSGGNGVQYTGFVYGENESMLGGTLTYSGSSQSATDVGSYGIVPGGYTSSNYVITYRNGSLSVTKRSVTVSFAVDAEISREYDGTAVATVTSQDLAFEAGEVIAGDELSVGLSSGAGSYADKNAGTGKHVTLPLEGVTLAGADKDNYAIGNTAPVKGDVGTITRKALTITANNHAVLYSGKAYSGGNGVVYEGFVPGEDESVLSGTLTYGGSSQGAVDVGSYTIIPSGLMATNYAPEYRTASLIVTPTMRALDFPALLPKTYGDGDFDAGARASSGEDIIYTSSNSAVAEVTAGGTIRITGAGMATITATVPENGNYRNKPELSHTLTVQKATQTITLDAPAEVHRDMGSVPVMASSSSGLPVTLAVDDPEVATLEVSTLRIHRLGTVRITATQAGDGNYGAAEAVTVTVRVTDPSSDFPVRVSRAVSPNGDGINEYLVIEAIKDYPDNRVSIFNRNGTVVYEASGYNNGTVAFRGVGTGEHRVPAGTYFFVAEIRVGGEWRYEKGWFVLRY